MKSQMNRSPHPGIVGLFSALALFVLYANPLNPMVDDGVIADAPLSVIEASAPLESIVRIRIPGIGVDASVWPVGLESSGAMGAPEGPSTLGWFDRGPFPGETGSAVIAGHFGWKGGVPAVFDRLSELVPGDRVYFQDGTQEEVFFIVTSFKRYDESEDASEVFFSGDGGSHLNLITCEGVWNKAKGSYSGRLVVFADKE